MSKAEIFNQIRRGLRVPVDDAARRAAVQARLNAKAVNLIPQRAQLPQAEQIQLFIDMAREAAAEVVEVSSRAGLTEAIETYLQQQGIEQLVSASDEALTELDWSLLHGIQIEQRVAQVGDEASLTCAFAGIAETGTLLLYSRPDSPTTLNFLPDTHLVVLEAASIVGDYETAWRQLREAQPNQLPRTVNLITGPSRSADIEQKLQMGAHGPRNLVIFLLWDQ